MPKKPRVRDFMTRVEALVARSGIDPDDIEFIESITLKEPYEAFMRGVDGEPEIVTLKKAGELRIVPKRPEGPKWPLVQPADPVTIQYRKAKPVEHGEVSVGVIHPDTQIGYRRLRTDDLEPFHNLGAMDVSLQIQDHVQPSHVGNAGDTVDWPEFSNKYLHGPEYAGVTRHTINLAYRWAAAQRQVSPYAQIDFMQGNHDARVGLDIMANAKAAYELSQALEPAGWPVWSLPHLLRFDELDINYHDGYPGNEHYWSPGFKLVHGLEVNSKGSTAAKYAREHDVDLAFGHVHRIEEHTYTQPTQDGCRRVTAFTPGTLAWCDGRVPGYKNGSKEKGGSSRKHEDWQNGMAVVWFDDTGVLEKQLVHIEPGSGKYEGLFGARFQEKMFVSRPAPPWMSGAK